MTVWPGVSSVGEIDDEDGVDGRVVAESDVLALDLDRLDFEPAALEVHRLIGAEAEDFHGLGQQDPVFVGHLVARIDVEDELASGEVGTIGEDDALAGGDPPWRWDRCAWTGRNAAGRSGMTRPEAVCCCWTEGGAGSGWTICWLEASCARRREAEQYAQIRATRNPIRRRPPGLIPLAPAMSLFLFRPARKTH